MDGGRKGARQTRRVWQFGLAWLGMGAGKKWVHGPARLVRHTCTSCLPASVPAPPHASAPGWPPCGGWWSSTRRSPEIASPSDKLAASVVLAGTTFRRRLELDSPNKAPPLASSPTLLLRSAFHSVQSFRPLAPQQWYAPARSTTPRRCRVLALPPRSMPANATPQLDKLVGLAMLVAATVVFLYYTIWTLLMPFVDDDHPLQNFFLPRVWAIRIPVILILLGSAVVGSFLGMVMIRSNRKKAAKAKAAGKKKA
ncbi:dolichol phosphate-mannose biosynthesis regulatory protein [Purpureocillium lilacinum]|uniref:Dolichol phosphate-mannose biosynthesis regulatory protein n=2 Tax=Purpureocillium lilacinum TaxID=33203 RepID=A0A2U3EK51_PURLI|nr:dolichol phosphate-mannose biosynthesis regulatory protein [Purpureocillium lilacinum]